MNPKTSTGRMFADELDEIKDSVMNNPEAQYKSVEELTYELIARYNKCYTEYSVHYGSSDVDNIYTDLLKEVSDCIYDNFQF